MEQLPPVPELGRSVFLGFERAPRPVLLSLEAAELRAGACAAAPGGAGAAPPRGPDLAGSGPNGAGKSTLLAALLARSDLPAERLLHLPQELPEGRGGAAAGGGAGPCRQRRAAGCCRWWRRWGAIRAGCWPRPAPSPGEARKLSLALGMGRHAWALLLDEPTNHLDLPAVERLEEALAAYPGAVLLVTHDARLAARCTGARWRIAAGGCRRRDAAGPPGRRPGGLADAPASAGEP